MGLEWRRPLLDGNMTGHSKSVKEERNLRDTILLILRGWYILTLNILDVHIVKRRLLLCVAHAGNLTVIIR